MSSSEQSNENDKFNWIRSYGRIKNRQISPFIQNLVKENCKKYILPFNNHLLKKIIDDDLLENIQDKQKKRDFLGQLVEKFDNKYHLEIGFGDGSNIFELAQKNPDILYFGAEPFLNGSAKLLEKLAENPLDNLFIFIDDARLLVDLLPEYKCEYLYILQPDPWPKIRQWKKRLISPQFIAQTKKILMPNGHVILSSDHADMLAWMMFHYEKDVDFNLFHDPIDIFKQDKEVNSENYYITKYMLRGKRMGNMPILLNYFYKPT